jgi:hypothetical protein
LGFFLWRFAPHCRQLLLQDRGWCRPSIPREVTDPQSRTTDRDKHRQAAIIAPQRMIGSMASMKIKGYQTLPEFEVLDPDSGTAPRSLAEVAGGLLAYAPDLPSMSHVRYWHKADIQPSSDNVRFWG